MPQAFLIRGFPVHLLIAEIAKAPRSQNVKANTSPSTCYSISQLFLFVNFGICKWDTFCLIFEGCFFFYSSRILFSISLMTLMNSSSLLPVGSGKPQSSSNALPMKGQPTSQPMEIAASGDGILAMVLLYCDSSISIP